jgi:HlyD family secretion protein
MALLAGLGFVGWRYVGGVLPGARAEGIVPEAIFKARRGDLLISVNENGYLKAKNSVHIEPQFQREATITWLVPEGKTVEKDELLAEFDKTDLENQIDDLERQLIQQKTDLEAAQAELEIQRRDSDASVESAKFNVKITELKLERYLNGDRPNEKRKFTLASDKAHSEFDRATERFRQVPDLAQQGFITKIQEEEERIRLREAEINKDSADKELELFERYTAPMEEEQLRANVKDAERVKQNAEEKKEISVKEKETRVSRADSQVKQTEQRLDKLKKELGFMTIKAPQPGVVHYGDPAEPWNRDNVKVGNRFYRGNTLLTLPDLREMQVLVNIHEADIDLVKLEQVVDVTVEAVKERVFKGKVTRVAQVANSDWMESANKTFQIEITMDPIDVDLRSGISAHVEIQVERLADALHVPVHAVIAENGKHFCFAPKGSTWEQRDVEIGKSNAHYVEVTKGLEVGDAVMLYDPRDTSASERDDGEKSEAAKDEVLSPAGVPAVTQ